MLKSFSKHQKILLAILCLLILLIRIFLSFIPSFEYDENDFRIWSVQLAQNGFDHFYNSNSFTNNPLGYLYVLSLAGLIRLHFFPTQPMDWTGYDILLKSFASIADILTGLIIFKIIKDKLGSKAAWISFLTYTLNPAIFFNSSIWGQYDGIAALFLLLTTYFLLNKKFPELAVMFFAIALSLKPQTISLAPVFGLILLTFYSLKSWILSAITFVSTAVLLYYPFFPSNPIMGVISVNQGSTALFNCTTCFAFNLWGIFGNWRSDSTTFLGLSYLHWGMILLLASFIPIFFSRPFKKRLTLPNVYLTAAVINFAFFTLLTRMHERYLFPFFPFFLLAVMLMRSKFLMIFYWLLSALYVLNLYIPYTYYNNQLHIETNLSNNLSNNFPFFSLISVLGFCVLLFYFFRKMQQVAVHQSN